MGNRIKFGIGCVLILPLVFVCGAALLDRFGNPGLTETELFNRWFLYVLGAALPAFGGYVLAARAMEDDAEE